jgi:hypothetical protein
MGYRNFKLAIYCPVGDLNGIKNINEFDKSFSFIEKYLQPDKVYLETFYPSLFQNSANLFGRINNRVFV